MLLLVAAASGRLCYAYIMILLEIQRALLAPCTSALSKLERPESASDSYRLGHNDQ
jgi:hypothetical protein